MLVCLDTLEPVSANAVVGPRPAWRNGAIALLAHARAHGWPVVHVLQRRPAPGQGGWRAAPGLSPSPAEPVFHREAPSAFRSSGFGALAAGGAKRLVLAGCSIDSACLATAVDGVQAGLRLIVPLDAVALPGRELAGLHGLAAIGERVPDVRLSLATVRQLMDGAPELRVYRGGRA
jgi:hypothetical protein